MNAVPLRSRFVAVAATFVFVIAAAASTAGQRPGGAQGGGGGLTVDFIALDAKGQPVSDLKPGDVTIRVANRNRTVSGLEFKMTGSTGGGAASALPPPFAVNAPAVGRSFLIVVDVESLKAGTERAIRDSLEELLKGLGEGDRVAFSLAPKDTAQVGFGAGLARVREALGGFTGLRAASVSSTDNACRTRDTLVLLRGMIEALPPGESPTSVLFIASGVALPNRSAGGQQSCEVTSDHFSGLATAAAGSRANLYIIQGDETVVSRDDGLENMAGVTNAGTVLRVTGGAVSRVLDESSSYYLATLQPDQNDRPGQVQRLDVRSNREGVTIRARSDVAIGRGGAGAGRPAGPTSPKNMVATTAQFTDLQLRATAVASRGQASKMTVLALAEPADPATKLTALSAVLVDSSNKVVFLTNADEKQLAARPIVIPLSADPGKYRMRVAATDDAGHSGAVDYQLTAELTTAGALKLGDLLLLGPRGESFTPQIQFSNEPDLGVYVEIYGQLNAQVSARFEIAATPDGPAIETAQPGGQGTSEPDKFILNGKISLAKLSPGDYVVRAIVKMGDGPEGRVMKTVRKVAK